MKRIILALVVMLGIVGRAEAAFVNGSLLLDRCEGEDAKLVACLGYLEGIYDANITLVSVELLKEPFFCILDGVSGSQLRKVFIKYANNHPENLHFNASGMVMAAFRGAFPPPCD